jgi:hypothetical protein
MKIKIATLFLSWMFVITGTAFGLSEIRPAEVINPSFETGDFTGWPINEEDWIWILDQTDQGWWLPFAVSELSPDGRGTDGEYFVMIFVNKLSQITDHVIEDAGIYQVSIDACSIAGAGGVYVKLGYDNGVSIIEDTTETFIPTGADDTGPWERFSFEYVPSSNAIGHNLYIEVGNSGLSENGYLGLDNVRVEQIMPGFSLISPHHEQLHVLPDAVLQWELEEGFTCDVYFGKLGEPNYLVIENAPDTTYDPYDEVDMELDTTYYWRVDPFDPNSGGGIPKFYKGLTWVFTTIGEDPAFLSEPESITVTAGADVEFSVEAASITPITYKWYKAGNDVDVLSSTDILTISDAQVDDEGYYYCVITNDTLVPVESAHARLMTERLVGWWKLDGDAVDSVNLEVPGAPPHDGILPTEPNFVAGIDGIGIEFFGAGAVIPISDSSDYFNFYAQGMTVSAWVNCSFGSTWDGVVGKKQLDAEDEDLGIAGSVLGVNGISAWTPVAASNMVLYGVGNKNGKQVHGNPDDGDIHDDEWHLITGVIEPDYSDRSCRVLIYVDGVLRETSDSFDMDAVPLSPEALVIGAENESGLGSFHGKVDDVRIYSYARNNVDIALMYTNLTDEAACIDQDDPWLKFDIAGEPGEPSWCSVDILDFAELAAVWMRCNLIPDCTP